MANETGFAPAYVKEAGEYAPGSFLSSAFSNRMFGPTNEDILWEHQYKVITDLAAKGPCVIVGRCADYILQDTADCLSSLLHQHEVGPRPELPPDVGQRRAGYRQVRGHHRAAVLKTFQKKRLKFVLKLAKI